MTSGDIHSEESEESDISEVIGRPPDRKTAHTVYYPDQPRERTRMAKPGPAPIRIHIVAITIIELFRRENGGYGSIRATDATTYLATHLTPPPSPRTVAKARKTLAIEAIPVLKTTASHLNAGTDHWEWYLPDEDFSDPDPTSDPTATVDVIASAHRRLRLSHPVAYAAAQHALALSATAIPNTP